MFDHDANVTLNALTCSGTSAFLKHGAGLLTLTGANTYTGTTAVEGGVLALSGAGTLGACGGLAVDGDLALANGLTLDFAGRSGLDLRAGEEVAVVTGTATLPNSAKVVNAGDVKAVTFVRDGTVVYARKIPGGTVLIIR